jgi:hypothetical protein
VQLRPTVLVVAESEVHEAGGLERVAVDHGHERLAGRGQGISGEDLCGIGVALLQPGQAEASGRPDDDAR